MTPKASTPPATTTLYAPDGAVPGMRLEHKTEADVPGYGHIPVTRHYSVQPDLTISGVEVADVSALVARGCRHICHGAGVFTGNMARPFECCGYHPSVVKYLP